MVAVGRSIAVSGGGVSQRGGVALDDGGSVGNRSDSLDGVGNLVRIGVRCGSGSVVSNGGGGMVGHRGGGGIHGWGVGLDQRCVVDCRGSVGDGRWGVVDGWSDVADRRWGVVQGGGGVAHCRS